MAALCSVSEHCESEIREKLQRAAMPEHDIQRIIDALYDGGFLDTARYCRAFSRDKLRFAHWGRIKIQQALRQKGLPDADIRQALRDLDEELGDDYRRILADTLRQKARSLGVRLADGRDDGDDRGSGRDDDDDDDEAADHYVRRQKLIRFAASRGFTLDEIMEMMS
ncbi:MAG: RecX family transcriptional regulator [Bacteroidaceae bacterium]|nr:RecX family transcriptional regulator [Bacteroidaceae bacterium]